MAKASTTEEARTLLTAMVQPTANPALTTEEFNELVSLARVPDSFGTAPDYLPEWKASTAYTEGTVVAPNVRNGWSFRCSVAGTSGTTEPTWDVDGETLDGTARWEVNVRLPYVLTFDLANAAAEGWEWKASKVVSKFDVQAGKVKASRSQVYDMCRAQAARFRAMAGAALTGISGVGFLDLDTRH